MIKNLKQVRGACETWLSLKKYTDDKPQPQPEPKPQPAPQPAPEPAAFVPSADFTDNTTDVLNTLNTEPLLGHMSDRVTLYYNSADQATAIDAVGATNALLYFSDAQTPWNLRLPEAQINK